MNPLSSPATSKPGTSSNGRSRSRASTTAGITRSPSSRQIAFTLASKNGCGYAAAECPPTTMQASGDPLRMPAISSSVSSISRACVHATPITSGLSVLR